MDGQMSFFDMIPKQCECGSNDIDFHSVMRGISDKYLYGCICLNCGRRGSSGGGWLSLEKTKEQAVKDWNENNRIEGDGFLKHHKMMKEIRGVGTV